MTPNIVVFSLKDCPHCDRAKTLLEDIGWEYKEISLSSYPEKRTDMLQLADRLTVPQLFVQGRHIGGAADLRELQETGKLRELAAAEPAELINDPRLQPPTYPPKVVVPPDAPSDPPLCIGGVSSSYVDLLKLLLSNIEVKDHAQNCGLTTVKQAFEGTELIHFLQHHFKTKTREEAHQAASQLLRHAMFMPATSTGTDFSESDLYRFRVHSTGFFQALNGARRWRFADGCNSDSVSDPWVVLTRLKGQLSKLMSTHTDSEGLVDYIALAKDPAFLEYELAVGEFQLVGLTGMAPNVRKAFVINLYNMVVPHAFAKMGIPSTDLPRVAFFDGVLYELGDGLTFSLNDLENGILRGNRAAPYHLKRPFSGDATREATSLPVDHRIHFALNCGARSCPPVKWFTPEAVDEELRIVAMAWVEQDDNVKVDLERRTLSLSRICEWYSVDFGSDKSQIARTLAEHARGDKKAQILTLLDGGIFALKYHTYDWSTNSSRALPFTTISLACFVR